MKQAQNCLDRHPRREGEIPGENLPECVETDGERCQGRIGGRLVETPSGAQAHSSYPP